MTIAVFRTCALGDAVQCTPLFQQIRADEPNARIHFFTSANVAPLFANADYLDDVTVLNSEWLTYAAGRYGLLRAWRKIARAGMFDVLISLEATWMRNLGSLMVRAPVKAGLSFIGKLKPFELFTHPYHITGDSRQTTVHASQQYLNLWLGITGGADRGFDYSMNQLGVAEPSLIAHAERPVVCIAPGTGNAFRQHATKQWHVASYIELAHQLDALGWDVAFVGGKDDLAGGSPPPKAINLLGRTSVAEVASVMRDAKALVGNDSGLFHLAQAVGCPAAGIFGPTGARFTGVFRSATSVALQASLPCVPCYRATCDHADSDLPKPCCMSAVTVAEVVQAVRRCTDQKKKESSTQYHVCL